jgi:uncharacterized protein YcaQ
MRAAYPLKAARTLALHAQGLTLRNGSEPPPTREVLYRLIEQLVSLQIDTLQRVQRTHYLVPWSRMGSYDPDLLDELAYGDPDKEAPDDGRKLFEYWFHAACYLPLEDYRFRLPRMHSSRTGRRERTRIWLAKPETQKLLKRVYARVKREGAIRARDFEDERDERGLWWDWKPAKNALEHLYNCGDLMIAKRIRFERVYDLVERVLPDWVDVEVPTHEDTALHVLERSARALGICTPAQIADYSHDMGRNNARPFIEQLLDRGTLIQVRVEGVAGEVFKMVIHKDDEENLEAAVDGSLKAQRTTFLSPFDSFFYPKGRDEQLWGFRQVLEAYKPAPQREWGYYCLPILYKDRLVGRLDPRLDRKNGKLHLEALYLEPGIELEHGMISEIALAMKDFMKFHNANELIIEQSRPRALAKSLVSAIG